MSNQVLGRVERMRLNPNRRRSNRSRGEHLSGKGGSSIDFADYRDYVAGDDVRYVDWNIFARLHRPYIKLFSHEEEMHVTILVDASTSMGFGNKFDRARQLAACFAIMGLMNNERVSLYACNHRGSAPAILPPCSGRTSLKPVLSFLESMEPGGNFPVDEAVSSMLKFHKGRGIAVVLSDFLTFGDTVRSFNSLFSSGLEIYAVQLLAPEEIEPDVTGDLRFVDAETGLTLDVSSAGDLLDLYFEHRLAMEEHLASECRKRNGRFVSFSSEMPLETMLFDELLRKGWVL